MQDHQRLKWLKIGLFCVFGYNYHVIDKVARIGKYGFTRDAIVEKLERDGYMPGSEQ